jgi:outer membrane protein OmpA-like peptidoglycan-associated protein
VDRDDRCPDVAGVAANDGCPWRDTPWLALVPFAFDRDTLDAAALQALQRVVDELARYNPSARIAISGHTDGLGAESYNRGLARRRADQVRDWLVQRGIAAQRIEVDALGSRQPIDLNDTEAGRAANRRAEVRILP